MENRERPDGSNATAIGWILVVVGAIAAFIGMKAETFEGMLTAFAVSNLGVGLGVLLLSLGYLVRAIWFLPAREIPQPESSTANAGPRMCEWCHRDTSPYTPCSSASETVNRERAPRLRDTVCQAEFQTRGLMPEGAQQ